MLKKRIHFFTTLIFILGLAFGCNSISDSGTQQEPNRDFQALNSESDVSTESTDFWVTAYLAAWNHNAGTPYSNWGKVTTEQIKWDAITHMNYFGFTIDADGTPKTNLNPEAKQNFNSDRLEAIVPAAHANNTLILFTVGGAGNGTEFRSAIQPENRQTFFNTIKELIRQYGFDGVDINMEPINLADYDTYRSFIRDLRTELDQMNTNAGIRPLLTAAGTKGEGELFGSLSDSFDQVNIMSYDFVLAWQGWQAYHHTALLEGTHRLQSTDEPFPSVDRMAKRYTNGGLSSSKLGIGVDFNGYVWNGVHFLDTWDGWPSQNLSIIEGVNQGGIGYSELAQEFNLANAQWDDQTQTSFLEIESPKTFIAFDNERSIKRKVQYAKEMGYGGVMIWSYAEDFMPDESQPLLQAVKEEVLSNSSNTTVDSTEPSVSIISPENGSVISNTTTLQVSASDNQAMNQVVFLVDQNSVGSDITAPYSFEWNSGTVSDGTHTLTARAIDEAGNTKSASVTLEVDNTADENVTEDPVIDSGKILYDDQIADSWINASWGADINFNSTQKVFSGTQSARLVTQTWGTLSLRHGNWGTNNPIAVDSYTGLSFSVYFENEGGQLMVWLEDGQGNTFGKIKTTSLRPGNWNTITLSMDELNPNKAEILRVNIQEISGAPRTFHIDKLMLNGTSGSSKSGITLSAPTLQLPQDGSGDLARPVSLEWNPVTDATSYDLQISKGTDFSNPVIQRNGLTDTFYTSSGLDEETTYYWRVRASAIDQQSAWSSIWSFSTQVSGSTSSGEATYVYDDQIKDPWMNTSRNTDIEANNSTRVFSGNHSIKITAFAWGTLSLLHGTHDTVTPISTSSFKELSFKIYFEKQSGSLNTWLLDKNENVIQEVKTGQIAAGSWKTITLSMNDLNPNNLDIIRISIQKRGGSSHTFFIDELKFN